MSALCAKAFGATKVFLTDINESRLKLASELGADGVFVIDTKNFNDKEMAQKIRKELSADCLGADVTIECTGVESSVCLAIHATKSGGKVGIVGLGADSRIPLSSAAMREVDLIGVCRIKDDYELAIQLISSGKLNVKPLITHKFKIQEAIEAFNLLRSGAEGVVKVLIQY
ncbi:unnamed protein product [Oppiella nova]|uniref:Alcohol dehydrogenase-like C-terminal domain-containing protein n=1 Tax=Oppiella nova TaxID=334625 RepID=A0A7R9QWT1_9ACAR|nr:unnamed protein product [Oppiella nova]CAG2177286.1 unnamed protein product [Oppiella nova]